MAAKLADLVQDLALSSPTDDDDDGVNHLDRLPDEILLVILDYVARNDTLDLIKLGCVCRRLRRLSHHSTLWTDIKLANGFSTWCQLVQLLVPRMNAGTLRVNLGRKHRRCDRLSKKAWVI